MTERPRVSNDRLNELRGIGDPLVDALVEQHIVETGESVGRLLGRLFAGPELALDHGLVGRYWRSLPESPIEEPGKVVQGQGVFDLFGPEVLLTLGSCALPLAYAAGNGVMVVARARKLKDDPIRRLCDTAQMVINVMQPEGLVPGGIGWRSIRKVRLIHALVRLHVQSDPEHPWQSEWGTPINQEDLTGTLLAFSVGVLECLRRLGAWVSADDRNAYVHAWRQIGRQLGVCEELLVQTVDEGLELALQIGTRQIRPTEEGRGLSNHLLDAVGSLFPLPGYAASLCHFFLQDSPFGKDVANVLGVPKPNWTRWLVSARAAQKRMVLRWLEVVPEAKRRRSFVARHFTQAALRLKHPDGRSPFAVPPTLARSWGLSERL
jgi:hypothetical protein